MPFANNQGVRVYYEVEGQGPPLMLAHGATGNLTFWRGYGYVDQLKDSFMVILFDARAHGKSDKPHEREAYSYQLMVGDVIAVLDALGVAKTHYWGYSMGGYIGFGLAKRFPERLMSLIVGGSEPYRVRDESDEPDVMLQLFRRGVEEGIDAVIEGMRAWVGSITPQYEERLRSLDLQAMVAYIEGEQNRPGFGDAVSQMKMPCLIYAGDRDEDPHRYGQKAVRQMQDARFCSLPGLNHVGAGSATELVVPQVLSFLANLKE